ncbi:MAG TPA: PDZ domain-containing protein [Burkholderiales bacterium]|nr:PDZ domain-containing protein [Burkholderiales bacterium]
MRGLSFLILPVLLAVAVAACDAPEQDSFRLVTVESQDRFGLSLRELPEATLKSIGLGYGLAVIRVGREGERAGLRLGDVVFGVNETLIHNLQEFSSALAQPREGRLSLLVRRGKADLQVPLEGDALPSEDGVLRMPRPATDTLLRT